MPDNVVNYGWFFVEKARRGDIPSVHEIDSTSLVSKVSAGWIEERYDRYTDQFFVARRHKTGEVIGYLTAAGTGYYTEQLPGFVYMSRFAVKDQFRRCGVGSALVVMLYDHMVGDGHLGIVGDVRKSNTSSLNFFINKHCFLKHPFLSAPYAYEEGTSHDDRYKVVVYKPFVMDGLR